MIQSKRFSLACVLGCASSLALSIAPAQAASFTADDVVSQCFSPSTSSFGPHTCANVNGFFTLTASTNPIDPTSDNVLTQKKVGGITGIGVAQSGLSAINQDPASGEISSNETLQVLFKKAATLSQLQLSFLYPPNTPENPAYGDLVFEAAIITAEGSALNGILTVTGKDSANWSGADGTVENLRVSSLGSAGLYAIYNPFGGNRIAGFNLTALAGANTGGGYSDFSLRSVSVPEPATLAGLGLVGLLAASRRRSAKQAN
ncbi:PEP-CTERM sorting domain-containing protein [Myxacorys almedinensis]|uniref:PEP-CTERM sorting domain-containing protein n=1 Tax=Myxacorys almedinensis TaxID=2651157 RepID=UPI00192ED2AC|nr:PEP-CTERM sorting domain-containing protein [Myxacorys almedinensis]